MNTGERLNRDQVIKVAQRSREFKLRHLRRPEREAASSYKANEAKNFGLKAKAKATSYRL